MRRIMASLAALKRSHQALIGLVLALILLLATIVFSNIVFKPVKFDLTEHKLFTVSDATRTVIQAIDEPVVLRLYFTKALGEGNPAHARHFERVRDLVERYVEISDGRLHMELYDAAPFSPAEDRAVVFGLEGLPFNQAGDLGYLGLVGTNSTDDIEVIRYFSPGREAFLEYDLTKLVYKLANPKKKVIGVISSLAIAGAGAVPGANAPKWPAIDQIREFFDVRPLPAYVETIPPEIDTLLIIHPLKFDSHALYAIDQFILRGGRALVFVDSVVETAVQVGAGPSAGVRSQFDGLLNSWGLSLLPGKVAGDLDAARRVRVRHEGRIALADYVAWLNLTDANVNPRDVVTADIRAINLGTAGILRETGGSDGMVVPLLQTGPRAMAIDARKFHGRPEPIELFRNFRPENKRYLLAARVTGRTRSAFPDGPPTKAKGGDLQDEHLGRAALPINVIVVADVDMLHHSFWADQSESGERAGTAPTADNVAFVVNALDNLTGSSALAGLRSRGGSERPFHLVEKMRQTAERKFRRKERELQQRLDRVRQQISALEGKERPDTTSILTPQERAEMDGYRREIVSVRRELRDVQRSLRTDLDQMDTLLKFLNIVALPLLLVFGAIAAAIYRRSRIKPPAHDT
jgi:ABC-type uncharacterized transport system involved in gliding motility auxiliary subunit